MTVRSQFYQLLEARDTSNMGAVADALGKAHELEFAKHISKNKQYPEHFRSPDGTPTEVAGKIRQRIGNEHYNLVSEHAKVSAANALTYLHSKGYKAEHIHKTTWVSQPGDVKRHTGVDDPNNNADVMITTHDGKHHGISLKYGTAPSMRSAGQKDMASMMGANHQTVLNKIANHMHSQSQIMSGHITSTTNTGAHKEFKKLAAQKSGAGKAATEQSLEHSRQFRSHLSSHYADSFNQQPHEHHVETIRRLAGAEPTVHPVYKVHMDPKKGIAKVHDPIAHHKEVMSRYHKFSAESSGINLAIYGHHESGAKHKLLVVSVKHRSSSPFTNIVHQVGPGPQYHT